MLMRPRELRVMTPPTLPDIRITITSGELAVRDALAELKAALSPLELDQEEIGTIELVLAEVMNNIVEHAYPPADRPGPITLNCIRRTDGLHFEVEDSGRPMPDGHTPVGNPANLDVDLMDLPEGGFGWFLIQDLAKDVLYTRHADTNSLSFRMALAG